MCQEAIDEKTFYKDHELLFMDVKKRIYPSSLENFKKLKNYIKKINNGRTKINRQDSTRTANG